MDNKNEIDDLFYSNVEPLEINPPENVWASIETRIDNKEVLLYKKRAALYRMLSFSLAVILIAFISYHFISTKGSIPLLAEKSKITEPFLHENNPVILNSTQESIIAATESKQKTSAQENKEANTSGITLDNRIAKKRGGQLANVHHSSQKNSDNHVNAATINTDKPYGENPIAAQPNKNIPGTDNGAKEESLISHTNAIENTTENKAEPAIESTTPETTALNDGLNTVTDNTQTPATVSPNKLSISILFSPDYSQRYLKMDDDGDDENDLDEREYPEFSFSAGLRLHYNFSDTWSFVSGLMYSTISQNIRPTTIYAKAGSDNNYHFVLPTSYGLAELPGSVNYKDSLDLEMNSSQLLQFISLPLAARFQANKNKLSYYIQAGVSVNFLIKNRVVVGIDEDENETIINTSGLKQMNYRFLLGAGLQYNLTGRVGVFIEPSLSGSFIKINKNAPVRTFPYSIGLGTGLFYRF